MDLEKLNIDKLGYVGLILGLSYIPVIPQLPQKMTLTTKVVKKQE